ncbi:RING-H2_zinc finger domain-containing protein [Hexamita inflata]|uniref:RING-H2 zinc finger domain-containing protein n=1 Tax=Hexamita inflata TaxID=28002 RepID=A0AA86RGX1_9EUKA|nr:RING-H2 zinc finger domain-containing protein [Hexamita inflata]CAI9969835.1 RING-H2 zinc finger domain-containing protein [Hexamita inflata]CAI9971944.1 RING-H2 zinc finger domain-containing protein [Hexamita inflata]
MQITKTQKIFGLKYNENFGDCTICKEKLIDPCMECKNFQYSNCQIGTGQCGHTFHLHCLNSWLENNGSCPMCTIDWKYQ